MSDTFGLFNNHPIPGQSLTKTPGSAIHQQPPQFAEVGDALEYVFSRLTNPRQLVRLILTLKKGVPAEYIARALLFQGFLTGKWSPDVALLMLKLVMAQIVAIAKLKGIKVKIFNEDKDQKAFLDNFLDTTKEEPAQATPQMPNGLPQFSGVLGGA